MTDTDRKTYQATFICLVLAALFLAAFISTAHASRQAEIGTARHSITSLQHREIRFQRVAHAHWTDREVRMTIRAAVARWPVPGGVDFALDVARCESGFEAKDSSPGSGYEGVYQQATNYWPARQNHYDSARWHLGESVNNGRSNVIVSIRTAHAAGWSSWSCA